MNSSSSDQRTTAGDHSNGSNAAASSSFNVKVESVEDHKKLKCLGMTTVEHIYLEFLCVLMFALLLLFAYFKILIYVVLFSVLRTSTLTVFQQLQFAVGSFGKFFQLYRYIFNQLFLTDAGVQVHISDVQFSVLFVLCSEPLEFREYCKRLFEFKTITVRRFRQVALFPLFGE